MELTKPSPKWYDPGDHLPWYLPTEEPPRHDPPDRRQLTILEALAKLPK